MQGDGQVTIFVDGAIFDGGKAITGYMVTPSPERSAVLDHRDDVVVAGLTNGQPYQFTVTSTNGEALSSTSEPSAAVTPVISVWLKVKAKKASRTSLLVVVSQRW